jgi:hypothetical protein
MKADVEDIGRKTFASGPLPELDRGGAPQPRQAIWSR